MTCDVPRMFHACSTHVPCFRQASASAWSCSKAGRPGLGLSHSTTHNANVKIFRNMARNIAIKYYKILRCYTYSETMYCLLWNWSGRVSGHRCTGRQSASASMASERFSSCECDRAWLIPAVQHHLNRNVRNAVRNGHKIVIRLS